MSDYVSEYQMNEIINVLRDIRADIKDNLEYIALCMVLNTITNNGIREITAQERHAISKVMCDEAGVGAILWEYVSRRFKQERTK